MNCESPVCRGFCWNIGHGIALEDIEAIEDWTGCAKKRESIIRDKNAGLDKINNRKSVAPTFIFSGILNAGMDQRIPEYDYSSPSGPCL